MIQIKNTVLRTQNNFWNACVFHPTDAVEDPWGRRILDQMAKDGAIGTVRVYSMFEDIVYLDEDGGLCYDFRLSDLRTNRIIVGSLPYAAAETPCLPVRASGYGPSRTRTLDRPVMSREL